MPRIFDIYLKLAYHLTLHQDDQLIISRELGLRGDVASGIAPDPDHSERERREIAVGTPRPAACCWYLYGET